MSYKVTKTISVPYIDHEYTVSGDTVHTHEVTRHKNVDINIHVETEPFDDSVDECCGKVDLLTASIGGYKVAHVAAKRAASDKIVDSATAGFTGLINQSINMQTAGQDAQMHALAGELVLQCKELDHKHDVMTNDFNRIKGRYTNLFTDLDNELKRRILQLCKPCFNFVENIRQEQNRRISSNLLSTATLGARESEAARTAIQASKVKQNAASLITAARDHVASHIHMENVIKAVSVDGCENLTYYVPVMMYTRCDEQGPQRQLVANPVTAQGIYQAADTTLGNLQEMPLSPDDRQRIDAHFNQMVEQQIAPQASGRRLADIMRHLYQGTEFTTYVTNQ
ncbi:MAG: hypothetical protein IJT98_02965 [Prevotella sp.]|nr:hypothetical protein [Prevotella sp.]